MEMWSCFDREYIEKNLDIVKHENLEITMWQSSSQGKEKFYGKLLIIGEAEITISVDRKEGINPMSANESLFVHTSHRDLIFKRDNFKLVDGNVVMPFPAEVKFKDKRAVPRFSYKYQDYKIAAYHVNQNIANDIVEKKYSATLIDISVQGIGVIVAEDEVGGLNEGLTVYISRLTDQVLPEPQKADVLYAQTYSQKNQSTRLVRIGIGFDEALGSVSYKSITSIIEKKQERVKGLEVDTYNGLNPDDFERVLGTIASNNPVLAANIRERSEYIDRLRYLTPNMKHEFILGVNIDMLAAALRLSSKELIFDLLSEVSDNFREDFLIKLDQPKPPAGVNKAQDEIYTYMAGLEKEGKIVLDPTAFETYV